MGYSRALRHACAIAAIAGLTTAASPQSQEQVAQSAQEKAAMAAWVECLFTRAEQLDDGVSPVDAIGRAIAPLCTSHIKAIVIAFEPNANDAVREALVKDMTRKEGLTAAQIVLRVRAQRKKVG